MARKANNQLVLDLFDTTPMAADLPGEKYPVSVTPEIRALLDGGSPVAIGVSGGKDSSAVALRLQDYLNEIGHQGPRVLIHSDLGRVEWEASLPVCEKLAERLGLELIVTRRAAGDMMDRWEKRWSNNVDRYVNLSCVKLILPWSTPSMRFCTSELKTAVICSELKKRFPGQQILSVTGIRHQESATRAKMPTCQIQPKLSGKNFTGLNWNPIITWATGDVYTYLEEKNEPLHEAYTCYGCSRVSCAFCIMSAADDLIGATRCESNHELYRLMVDLEIRSTFAFQGHAWLGDVSPNLLPAETRQQHMLAKVRAKQRVEYESMLPKHLLYVSGWPAAVPSLADAGLLATARTNVAKIMGIEVGYTTPTEIRARYEELMALQLAKVKKKKKNTAVNVIEDSYQLAA